MRHLILASLLAAGLIAQPTVTSAECPTVTSITTSTYCVVQAGKLITLTASSSVTWTLTGTTGGAVAMPAGASTSIRISLPSFGQYDFTAGSRAFSIGAVVTDASNRVVYPAAYLDEIIGPQLRHGTSIWPGFDDWREKWMNRQVYLQDNHVGWTQPWNVALAGTISVTNGSTAATGSGTAFDTDLCTGGNQYLIIWHTLPWGTTGRKYNNVNCSGVTATSITLGTAWTRATGTYSYSKVPESQLGYILQGTGDSINYYDITKAFYAFYYATGFTVFQTKARAMADLWWTMPWIDQGFQMTGGDGTQWRNLSFQGTVLRALDGKPDYWNGAYYFLDATSANLVLWGNTLYNYDGAVQDLREQAYQIDNFALTARHAPDSAKRLAYRKVLYCNSAVESCTGSANIINGYFSSKRKQSASGTWWDNVSYGTSWFNGTGGTVTLTKGSTTVTGSGTSWLSGWTAAGNYAYFMAANSNWAVRDSVAYVPTFVSSTEVTLDRPYEGVASDPPGTVYSGRAWQFNNVTGLGVQPFMQGLWLMALDHVCLAAPDSEACGWISGTMDYLVNEGVNASWRGMWYGLNFANCIAPYAGSCLGGTVPAQGRMLSPVTFSGMGRAYQRSATPTRLAALDNLFSAVYGSGGGPGTDSDYPLGDLTPPIPAYPSGGWFYDISALRSKGKWPGEFWGVGASYMWPSLRTGNVAAYSAQNVYVKPPSGASEVNVLTVAGATSTVSCTTVCAIPADARTGSVFYRFGATGAWLKGSL